MQIVSKDKTGKHLLVFDEDEHVYKLDGKIVPGATGIKKAYPPSEALVQYMIRQGIDEYKTGKKLKRKAGVGTVLHDYAFCLRTGKKFDEKVLDGHVDADEIKTRMKLVDQFLLDQHDDVIMAEEIIASVDYQYGGKFDVLVRRGDEIILQDYKSSKGFFEDQFIQLGLYARALSEWKGIEVTGFEVIRFSEKAERPESFLIADSTALTEFIEQGLRCRQTLQFQDKWKVFFDKKYKDENKAKYKKS